MATEARPTSDFQLAPPRGAAIRRAEPATRLPAWPGQDWRVLLLAVMVISAAYVAWHLGRGWVAHDEGTLGQSAERLLRGELPHRDFDDVYTGGLTFLNAAAFRLFGATMMSMRIVLFAAFLAWVPAVFYVASRFVRPAAAAVVTLLCVAWSLPNYPAPLPSWYNLFLTVIGTAAICRWLEDRRPRWLIAAGIAAGLSLVFKVIGLYFVGSALLFLVFQAHEDALHTAGDAPRRGWLYGGVVTLGLLALPAALTLIVRRELHLAEIVHFILPGSLLAAFQIWREWSRPAGASSERFPALGRLIVPFLVGFAFPVALFLIPYARAGAVGAVLNGVFVLPTRRFEYSSYRMLSLWALLGLVPVWLLLAYGRHLAERLTRYHVLALTAGLGAFLYATGRVPLAYRLPWYAARSALPVLIVIGVAVLAPTTTRHDATARLRRSRTMLLMSAAGIFALVQFPFSVPVYFCYEAPLVALLAVALLGYLRPMAPAVPAALTLFFLGFAVLRMNTSELFGMGVLYKPYPATARLAFPRGGLAIPVQEAAMYRAVVNVLQPHVRGSYTFASPDCPEIYFLTGLENPTRTLFDFFDTGEGRTGRILESLARHQVTAVVLNSAPQFSPKVPADLQAALEARYPFSVTVGKFEVRWQ